MQLGEENALLEVPRGERVSVADQVAEGSGSARPSARLPLDNNRRPLRVTHEVGTLVQRFFFMDPIFGSAGSFSELLFL